MGRFIEGIDRDQAILLPECLDDYVGDDSPVRAIVAFINTLKLSELGFHATPVATGRPSYHPGLMLRIYLYGYLSQVQSSRRLERECGRNRVLIWLTGRLKPDFKTIADVRKITSLRSAGCINSSSRYAARCGLQRADSGLRLSTT